MWVAVVPVPRIWLVIQDLDLAFVLVLVAAVLVFRI